VETLVKTVFTTIFIVSVLISVSFSFYSQPIMQLLYHESPEYSARILQWLIFCFIGSCTVYIFGTLLTANGNLYQLSFVSLIAVAVNFFMNLYFIPRFKAVGAAEVAVTTQILIALLNFIAAVKIFKWKPNIKLLLRLILFTLFTVFLFWISRQIHFTWFIVWFITGIIGLVFAFSIGLLRVNYLMSVISSE